MVQTTFRFGELEAILADINEIPSAQRTSFQARLKDIQRHGLLRMETLPRGKAAAYGLRELALLAVAIELCQFGLSTKRAVQVMLTDEYPLWMAVMMGANAIERRPDVFRVQGADEESPEGYLCGFSSEWADNEDTDPSSVFLHFDPSALAPWSQIGDDQGEDIASATFFYSGIGIVKDSISRWTTGPTRRLALINVTKLVFDIATYIAGPDGLTVCEGLAKAANDYLTRGEFDLDEWLGRVTRAMGYMVAAAPDQDASLYKLLSEMVDGSKQQFGRYIIRVEQAQDRHRLRDRQRPDLIVRLPGQRELMVDDKVIPLADIPQMGIDQRLTELAEQPYKTQFTDRTDWTVLYIPDEFFFARAVSADKSLIERALKQKVLIAPPSVFMNLLEEVDIAWTKYREEFPDLWEDEFSSLGNENSPDLAADHDAASSKLPKRIPPNERNKVNG